MIIEHWKIVRESEVDDFCQSVFFLGNGTLGVRGFGMWEVKQSPQQHGIFRAGLFEEIKPGITDMVQLPDVLTLRLSGETPRQVKQTLDMRKGILTQAWQGERGDVCMERAVSMADSQLVLQRVTVTAREAGLFALESVANAEALNLPVHDDQMVSANELVKLLALEELAEGNMRFHTLPSGRQVEWQWTIHSERALESETRIDEAEVHTCLTAQLEAGETWTVEKRARLLVGGEAPHKTQADPWQAHEAAFKRLWRDCDMELDGDDELQGAVRYNIFQLLCNNAAQDPAVSIGARGLSHGRYKGNTFWDTEIFMFPFYLWTRPEAALNLMLYRANLLEDARALAGKQNLEGARYPWMCSADGREQCESWDIGLCEIHVTADIAYAMERYGQVTGDKEFVRSRATEVWRESARYWKSRLTWEPGKGQYSSFFVKGPDEYCGVTVNNTFTNYMARHNIRLALAHAELGPEEREQLRHAEEHITILYDEKRKLYLQDEMLERLEEAPFLKKGDAPAYRRVCFDRMQRYRALKQADLVLLMTLFPGDFTQEEKRNVFAFYEPITLHDSTLSYGVHAQLALELGLEEKAWEYLRKALFLDLKDVMGNTGQEGIHMAALGAAWQALAFGAAGLMEDGNGPGLRPRLPKGIRRLRFHVYYHGRRYAVEATRNGGIIKEEA